MIRSIFSCFIRKYTIIIHVPEEMRKEIRGNKKLSQAFCFYNCLMRDMTMCDVKYLFKHNIKPYIECSC